MDVREKLVELLQSCVDENVETDDGFVGFDVDYGKIADHLIANGVTVQEWITTDERKPKYGEDVLVVVFDGYDTYTDTDCLMRDGKWCYETENHKVTHWQPMPQPPKGE